MYAAGTENVWNRSYLKEELEAKRLQFRAVVDGKHGGSRNVCCGALDGGVDGRPLSPAPGRP